MNDITFFNNRLRDRLIERYHRTGRCGPQSVPGLNFSVLYDNVEVPSCFYHLAVALILQGEKTVTAGSRVYRYGEETAIVTASDLPTSYRLEASRSKPFVSTSLQLDARNIEELVRTEPRILERHTPTQRSHVFSVFKAPEELLSAFDRLIQIVDDPERLRLLGPGIVREIHYHLLVSETGAPLCRFYENASIENRIAKSIHWIRQHFREPIDFDALLGVANMSQSTFYRHFRDVTGLTPLQYRKVLCLHEAQSLMLSKGYTATRAAYEVGYKSPQQFTREYKRTFGHTPRRSVQDIREGDAGPAPSPETVLAAAATLR